MPNPQEPPAADDVGAIIARIRELDKAATPGPWRVNASEPREITAPSEPMVVVRASPALYVHTAHANSNLIAEYRTLAVQLAAHVEALQADKRKMASAIRAMSVNLAGLRDELSQLAGAAAESADIAQRYDAAAGEMVPFPTSEGRADG